MHIVLFDVDGTLTDSCRVDDACYLRAIREVFDIEHDGADWAQFTHTTDYGIASELYERARGCRPDEPELDRFRIRFTELIRAALIAEPDACRAVSGGPALLRELGSHEELATGIATGGLRETAQMKLAHAEYQIDGIPLASSTDARAREEIIRIAIDRAGADRRDQIKSITYIGDGVWDARAADNLGIRFVGVGTGVRADELRRAGAAAVVPDFSDPARLFAALR